VTPPVKYTHQGKPGPRYLHVAFDVEGEVYSRAQELTAPVSVPGVKTRSCEGMVGSPGMAAVMSSCK